MPNYKAPLKDIQFLLYDVFDIVGHAKGLRGLEDLSRDDLDAILSEAANFVEKEVHPLMREGDEEGVGFKDGEVTLPKGWVQSYKLFVENGWPMLEAPDDCGGTPMPAAVGMLFSEMQASANLCWGMLPGLTTAAVEVLHAHASDELKQKYLGKMVEGQWFGTMCLTEAQSGTDLNLVRTKATPQDDGSYSISGSKMFITGGDHDASENIIHLVLARIPGAPEGTKGISLFLVPKHKSDDGGSITGANGVTCGSIEHKMGIKASPTCVLNFDNSEGYLIGEANSGLAMMFTMMNIARIGTGIQGYASAVSSFQGALEYAKDRLQMRSLSGPKNPEGPADPIIVHPDVRKMLLTQKSLSEGCRALVLYASTLVDQQERSSDEEASRKASSLLGLLTPIIKGFSTEIGIEAANHGIQVLGGHGYICEHGMEQIARDARISSIYEGTTGIQALDLLGRKIFMNEGKLLGMFCNEIGLFCQRHQDKKDLAPFFGALMAKIGEWGEITAKVGAKARKDPEEVGAASVDYLMYAGYVSLAYFWARMAVESYQKLGRIPAVGENLTGDEKFYAAKIDTARFYFDRILPRTETHKACMLSGAANLMNLEAESFGLDF